MITLRPYQEIVINGVRDAIKGKHNRIVLCGPTGMGKTICFTYMASRAIEREKKVLILTDRIELLTQAGNTLGKFGLTAYQIRAGQKRLPVDHNLYVAMIETFYRRLKQPAYQTLLKNFDLVIADEAHKQTFDKIIPHLSDHTILIGATATPHRKGNQRSLDEFYTELVQSIGINDLVSQGYLAQPRVFGANVDLSEVGTRGGDYDAGQMSEAFSKQKLFKGVVENYERLAKGKKTLVFSASIKNSLELLEEFEAAGVSAKHIDGSMGKVTRRSILNWFSRTPGAVLLNVGVLTTGFDEPSIECVVLYRATKSLPLYLQMVGRGSRVIAGIKDEFTILDFGNNTKQHGMWDDERTWSLKKKKKQEGAAPVKSCPQCEAMTYASARICGVCNHEFEFKIVEQEEVFLVELTPKEWRSKARASSLEQKVEMVKQKKIKAYWVLHNMTDYDEAEQFGKALGWKWTGWWKHNAHRFPNLQQTQAI